jgi:protoheme IX farnesyltransferase
MPALADDCAARPRPGRREDQQRGKVRIVRMALSSAPGTSPVARELRAAALRADDFVQLMKPGILSLLLVTMLCGMMVAVDGAPPLGLTLFALIGGTLAAGGANALNCFIDRDIDAIMPRTQKRGTASGTVSPATP